MEKLTGNPLSEFATAKFVGDSNIMSAHKSDGSELLQTPLHGVFIPAGLVIFGTALLRWQWTGYAIILAAVLSAFKFYRGRTKSVLKKDDFQEFPLIEKTILTHNTAVYRFSLPSTNNILGLPIGQHVVVSANINGKDIARSYTPTSSDDDRGYFDLLIKSYPTGNISRHFASLQLGQPIKVKGPKGNMVYKPNMIRAIGMIAGGTGITPMLQIIRAILKNPEDKTEISLIFANVNPEDILLRDDLEDLAAKNPQLKVSYVLNNPPPSWSGPVGFVTSDLIREKCPPPADDIKILICGPPPMVSAMKKATLELGYQKTRAVSKLEDQVFVF